MILNIISRLAWYELQLEVLQSLDWGKLLLDIVQVETPVGLSTRFSSVKLPLEFQLVEFEFCTMTNKVENEKLL